MKYSHCYVKERTKGKTTVRVTICHGIDRSKFPVEEKYDNDLHPTVVGDEDPEIYSCIEGNEGEGKGMYEFIGGAKVVITRAEDGDAATDVINSVPQSRDA